MCVAALAWRFFVLSAVSGSVCYARSVAGELVVASVVMAWCCVYAVVFLLVCVVELRECWCDWRRVCQSGSIAESV